MTTQIFVSVGTDHHPFTRLLDWIDEWMEERTPGSVDVNLVVQHGAARPSRHGVNHELLGTDELRAQYDAADLVVSQVGPGTIADANRAGRLPIVVPRDPSLGEVVDDHQVAFGEFMTARGRCRSVRTREQFRTELESRLLAPPPGLEDLPAFALPARTVATLSALSRTVLASPRRHTSARRLVTAVRRTA
ncbi:MAG: glycosyltransferase [Brachybacterium sp.]|uniref:glycosyltransferase n=1 Tax=Brachybacterium sp. AOP42-C2-15 TaxID=3457670 RepID=UPI003FE1AAC7